MSSRIIKTSPAALVQLDCACGARQERWWIGAPEEVTKNAIAEAITEDAWSCEGEVLRCEDCTVDRACEQQGHDWWTRSTRVDMCLSEMVCGRCMRTRIVALPVAP